VVYALRLSAGSNDDLDMVVSFWVGRKAQNEQVSDGGPRLDKMCAQVSNAESSNEDKCQ
jgi:hypothetical protein